MKVKGNLFAAISLGAAMVCGSSLVGIAPAMAAPAHTVSRAVGIPLKAAQEDLQRGDYSAALDKLSQAEALPKKSPYEQFIIYEMEGYAYVRTRQYPQAAKALEAQLSGGFLTAEQVAHNTVALAQLNYQIKNYDKAIQFGQEAIDKGWADAQMPTLVGQAYYLKGDWRGVVRFEKDQITADQRRGAAPSNASLQLLLSACVKMSESSCTDDALQDLILYHPKPQYWQGLVASLLNSVKSDSNLLQTYRLASEVDVLKRPEDFTDFAQLAIEAGSPGEAEQVIQKGLQENVFTNAREQGKAERLLNDAKRQASQDLATLPKTAEQAALASTGNDDVALGLAYYGYQQYDKAVTALTQGIAKGGLKDPPEAHLLLGIAQLKAGNRSAALQSFRAVKGNPTLERLATLWSLRARQSEA